LLKEKTSVKTSASVFTDVFQHCRKLQIKTNFNNFCIWIQYICDNDSNKTYIYRS